MIKLFTFHPPHTRNGFYEKMGKFFAERVYQRQLPYLVNSSSTTWIIAEKDSRVIAFGSFEQTHKGIEIGDIYTIDDDYQLWRMIASKISILVKKIRPELIYTAVQKKDDEQYKYFVEKEFSIKRETKNFLFLEKRSEYLFETAN